MEKYNGNAAYDLSLFEEKPRKPKREYDRRRAPGTQTKKEAASISFLQSVKIVVAAAIIIFAVAMMINGRVRLTEIKTEISEKQAELTAAQSENTRLQMELNSSVSLDNVENYAVNVLGMKKLEKYQMDYTDLADENTFELANQKNEVKTQNVNRQLKEIFAEDAI